MGGRIRQNGFNSIVHLYKILGEKKVELRFCEKLLDYCGGLGEIIHSRKISQPRSDKEIKNKRRELSIKEKRLKVKNFSRFEFSFS